MSAKPVSTRPTLPPLRGDGRAWALAEAGERLGASLDYETTLHNVVGACVPALGDFGFFDMLEDDGSVRRIAASHEDPRRQAMLDASHWVRSERRDLNLCALSTGEPALHADTDDRWMQVASAGPEHLQAMRALGFRSMITVPLTSERRLVGALTLFYAESGRRHGADDLLLATDIARRAVSAVENARLLAQVQRANDRLQRLQRLTAALSEPLTPHQIAKLLLEQTFAPLGAENGAVWSWEEGLPEALLLEQQGLSAATAQGFLHVPLTKRMPLTAALLSGETEWIRSRAEYAARYPDLEKLGARRTGEIALAVLPFVAGGRVLGGIVFTFPNGGHLRADEREFLQAVARQCAQAFDRVRLFATERRERERAELTLERTRRLQKVTSALSAAASPEELARVVVDEAFRSLLATHGSVMLPSADGKSLSLLYARGIPEERLAAYSQVSLELDSAATYVARTGRPAFYESLEAYEAHFPRLGALLRQDGVRDYALIAFPLGLRPVHGVLTLGFVGRQLPTGADVELLDGLGHQLSQGLERSRLYAQAQEAIRLRDDFLSVAGHELRTPLAALQLIVHGLERAVSAGAPQEEVGRRIVRARSSTGRLITLVDSLLDVSRLTAGRLELARTPVDLSQLCADVAERFRESAAKTGATILTELQPVAATVDALRIEQVVSNLLSNAIKYGDGAPITMTLANEGHLARLIVRDRGIGIAPEHHRRIFERFERAVSTRYYGGLGIGLWVARELVEAHGGRIALESAPGAGASFTVELPLP